MVEWKVCGEELCVSRDDAEDLAMYFLAMDQWIEDYKQLCKEE